MSICSVRISVARYNKCGALLGLWLMFTNSCARVFVFSPNSRIMLHQPSGGAQGMASDIEIQAREILRTRERLNNLYHYHTGQSLEDIERVMDRDTFMDVDQAMDFGVIDKVLQKRTRENSEDENEEKTS